METIEKISSKLEGLTEQEVKEVEDFIDFLVHKSNARSSHKNGGDEFNELEEDEILNDEFAAELEERIKSKDWISHEEIWGKLGVSAKV